MNNIDTNIKNALRDGFLWLDYEHYGDSMVNEYAPYHEYKKGWGIESICDFNYAYGSGSYPKTLKDTIEYHIEKCQSDFCEDHNLDIESNFFEHDNYEQFEYEYFHDLLITYFARIYYAADEDQYYLECGYGANVEYAYSETLTTKMIIDPNDENLWDLVTDKIRDIK